MIYILNLFFSFFFNIKKNNIIKVLWFRLEFFALSKFWYIDIEYYVILYTAQKIGLNLRISMIKKNILIYWKEVISEFDIIIAINKHIPTFI